MRISAKRAIFTTCLIVLGASLASQVSAQSKRLYLAGYMGLNMPFEQEFTDSTSNTSGDITIKNAPSFAGALGFRLTNNIRIEAELGYKSSDADTIDYSSQTSEKLGGSLKSFNTLLNVYYDFDVPWKVKPYVGGGLGLGWYEGEFSSTSGPNISEDAMGLIWNAGAGLKYRTRSNVAFTAGYRYLDGTELDFDGFDLDYSDHEIRIGVEYDLP